VQDKAKYYATLYLQDLSDFIRETVDPLFGFSRYAERLGHSANSFDELQDSLNDSPTFTDQVLWEVLQEKTEVFTPDLVLVSVPFPGNLYSGFRTASFLKSIFPNVKISLGGGFPNTELRELSDPRVFDYFDFVTLDDGERPVQCLLEYLEGKRSLDSLKRTFVRIGDEVQYINEAPESDIPFAQTGTPDYTDIDASRYISVLEIANPMHRLWSDGRWNKLTMAHGCYWKKCSFCDVSLDYISVYEPVTAKLICDRMQEQMETTGETGFHFVDEAAPPSLMKEVALEILSRKMVVTWWANIRFEEAFTPDLCQLLALSGCVAVSGGLEVASDRLLELMEKGVSVGQVAQVCQSFTNAGILVHAYLMYGFPTQTVQETVDSLEIVRQLFEMGIVQSGFWHLFAMTAHSPVGLNPSKYEVIKTGPEKGGFAFNDLSHEDPTGADHELFSEGLRKSLFNFMNGVGFDFELQEWFDFEVPSTKVPLGFIQEEIDNSPLDNKPLRKVLFLGKEPEIVEQHGDQVTFLTETRKGTISANITNEMWEVVSYLFTHAKLGGKLPTVNEIVSDTAIDFYNNSLISYLREQTVILVL